ncbi:MAG TPA: terminase family protein [Candidatus Sulfotelmatobacter sp.]|nr:terminase family protein [Candidatus Sulfotelmatobacter sp.]
MTGLSPSPNNSSPIESLRSLKPHQIRKFLQSLTDTQAEAILWDWRCWARPNQLPPGSKGAASDQADWLFWLVLAGRGFGKTRTGAETVREWARNPEERILMVAPTAADVREVMIEGPSGLMACFPLNQRPLYNSSRHLVQFASGAVGITRSADEPERLRGPQFTKFWADELAAWRFVQEAWDQIMFGFRLKSQRLQGVITTTPKPIAVLKKIIANPQTVVTRGSSYENRAWLSESFFREVIAPYEGTRLGRQEINAELLEDVPGALWTRGVIDASRITMTEVRWDLIVRTVIAIDPAVTSNPDSDETGIVAAALTRSGHVLILDDLSCRESPAGWAKRAIAAYHTRKADRIVGEVNNGGDLVEANIRAVDANVSFRAVRASRGKYIRAEPVAALYEQGRCHHVGSLATLEDQMCNWTPQSTDGSPDRLDALVWAATELVIDQEQMIMQSQMGTPYQISSI